MKSKIAITLLYWVIFSHHLVLAADLPLTTTQAQKIQADNLFPKLRLETSVGNIIIEINRYRAPISANNFLSYALSGNYDGTVFHRVVKDFVVQGGGYDSLYTERKQSDPIINESGNGLKNETYTIGMARQDKPHSATNQFYFNMADNDNLDPGKSWGYTVFGTVLEGSDILDLIANAKTHFHAQLGWEDVPVKPILLKKVILLEQE